jgi:type I restriction enzyme S subunit
MTPEGWGLIALRDVLADETPGFWGDPETSTGRVAVMRSTNLQRGIGLRFTDVVWRSFPEKKRVEKRLLPGDIVLERSGGGPKQPVGRVALFENSDGVYSCSNFMQRLRPDSRSVEARFLVYELAHFYEIGGTESLQQATTGIRNLQYRDYLARLVRLPPLGEQRKIAAILSSVDDALEAAHAVIDQLQVVKKAMMAELLARGLRGRHTRFKQTEIGELPEAWDVVRLDAVVDELALCDAGLKKADGVELPYLRVANVQDGHVDLTEIKTISVETRSVDRYRLRAGDVLFTEGGDADKLGRGCVWRAEIDPCLHQNHVFAVRPNTALLSAEYLAYWAASTRGKAYFLDCAKQTTNLASINSSQLKALPIGLPPMDEQRVLVSSLQSIDERLAAERTALASVSSIKQALMSVLLTGEVRVTPEQPAS